VTKDKLRGLAKILESKKFQRIYFFVTLTMFFGGILLVIDWHYFVRLGYPGIFLFNCLGGFGTYLTPFLARHFNPFLIALCTALGMSINDSMSYIIGFTSTSLVRRDKWVDRVEKLLSKYDVWGLFFLSILPVPFDIIGFISGYLDIKYAKFFSATFAGKFLRILLVATGTVRIIAHFR
jgi:membrane protein YqaA with SNARE-associated domain